MKVNFAELAGTINRFPMLIFNSVSELERLISMGTDSHIFGKQMNIHSEHFHVYYKIYVLFLN